MNETVLIVSAIAMGASVVFAFSNHVQHIALDYMDVRTGTIVNVGTTFLFLWLLSPFYFEPETLLSRGAAWFALAGLIVPSLSMTLHTMSVLKIGPGLTAGLASTAPVFAMVLAVLILGELVTFQTLAGTAIVVGGIAVIALRSRGGGASWPMWAMIFPLGAALTRALSHNIVKIGLGDLPNPMTAALIGSATSFAVIATINLAGRHTLPRWNMGYFWFGLCGILNGIGLVGLNVALGLGDVVVVSPLIATSPVFTLLVGWMFFRREALSWPSVIATIVIFCGCMLIILR